MRKSTPVKTTATPAPIERPNQNLHGDIALQAFLLWRSYGEPEGRDLDTWLEAERQVLGVDPLVRAAQNTGAVSAATFAAGSSPVAPPSGSTD